MVSAGFHTWSELRQCPDLTTSQSSCPLDPTEHWPKSPEEAYQWSKGKALYARTGYHSHPFIWRADMLPGQPTTPLSSPRWVWQSRRRTPSGVNDENSSGRAALRTRLRADQLKQGLLSRCSRTSWKPKIKVSRSRSQGSIRQQPGCRGTSTPTMRPSFAATLQAGRTVASPSDVPKEWYAFMADAGDEAPRRKMIWLLKIERTFESVLWAGQTGGDHDTRSQSKELPTAPHGGWIHAVRGQRSGLNAGPGNSRRYLRPAGSC